MTVVWNRLTALVVSLTLVYRLLRMHLLSLTLFGIRSTTADLLSVCCYVHV